MTTQIDPHAPAAAPTTAAERSPRVRALLYDDGSEYGAQTLAELGAFLVATKDRDEIVALIGGHERRSEQGIALAAKINATLEPEVPAFELEEQVSDASGDPSTASLLGRVEERYLNERGEWEYVVRLAGRGIATETYAEAAIAPFPHQSRG